MEGTMGMIILMYKKWSLRKLAMLDRGGRTGSEPGHETCAHQATPHSRSWVHVNFHFWIPTVSRSGPQEMGVTMAHAYIVQEINVCVTLISLNTNLGSVAMPLFFLEASLHSG